MILVALILLGLILLQQGVSGFINPLTYNTAFNRDIGLIAAGTFILFVAMYTGKKKQIDRWEAVVLLAMYVAYFIWAN